MASGLYIYSKNKHFPTTQSCRVDGGQEQLPKPLQLKDMLSAFFVLAIGIAFSVVAFIWERIAYWVASHNDYNRNRQI